jgi:elongation factor 3
MDEILEFQNICKQIEVITDMTELKKSVELLNPCIMGHLTNIVLDGISKYDWKIKINYLRFFRLLLDLFPDYVVRCLPDVMNKLRSTISDTKKQVKEESILTLQKICESVKNPDIKPALEDLMNAYIDPVNKTTVAIDRLYSTTFVNDVDTASLSIIVPILMRSSAERNSFFKRRSAVIIDNMCKLVNDPKDALLFYPVVNPFLEKLIDEVQYEEIRNVCSNALKNINNLVDEIGGEVKGDIKTLVLEKIKETIGVIDETQTEYVCALCSYLVKNRISDDSLWNCIEKYVNTNACDFIKECKTLFVCNDKEEVTSEDDLCNVEFSLAYGSRVLLHQARLHLRKGRKYGLIGVNGCGKSTLMKSIANRTLNGFPEELTSVYVEHDIQGFMEDLSAVEFIKSQLQHITEEKIRTSLEDVGFSAEMQDAPITSFSGGWRMKLALTRAILTNADLVLLDEPTNHLDVVNVAWVTKYIQDLQNVTCLIVSHDTKFLDNVCTDIIHYESNKKLKKYTGNLADFVKVRPEAKMYYEFVDDVEKFNFPDPGYLEGVKSLTKAILKLRNFNFQYPNTNSPQLLNINCQVSLASRIGVIGPNGAGKSTLIKLMVGELTPSTELSDTDHEYYRHPNLRIAYVAQHAFHHIEDHLDKSPVEYVMWRYSTGVDKEQQDKDIHKMTEEEERELQEKLKVLKLKEIEEIVGRIQGKREYEYKIKYKDSIIEDTLKKSELVELGYNKLVEEYDLKMAMERGNDRKLTKNEIQKHFETFGLEAEHSVHGKIRGLSGGQKMRVTLGSATYFKPHVIVLDEPSNFLDRTSLCSLASAIKEFQGGIVVISHNSDFVDKLCPEKWFIKAGKMEVVGGEWMIALEQARIKAEKEAAKQIPKEAEEKFDAFGNTIKEDSKPKELDRKKRKELEKKRKDMLKRGEDVYEIEVLLGMI